MALLVQKFGGTSVGTIERIRHVAGWALDTQAKGHDVVVVVSAMAGETNRLVGLATQVNPVPHSREYDLILASGEQVSVGLVALAINTEAERRGLGSAKARGWLGNQLGILTDSIYSKARIHEIRTAPLRDDLARGVIPVIAGFQGVDAENNITTLGRGGSDTSAVAIAAALRADDCEIYTDVDGVYTTDPRIYPGARKIDFISYEEMMELASLGAKVLLNRSVELAAKFNVPVHVRSSFSPVEGTRVVSQEKMKEVMGKKLEQVVVSGVAADLAQVKLTLQNLPDQPGLAATIFGALADQSVVVDVIVQDVAASGMLTVSFTIEESELLRASRVLKELQDKRFAQMRIIEEKNLAKISIVGVGMQHNPGVAARMFRLLADAQINIKLITTSEIKVSCLVDREFGKRAVECLHRGFDLDRVQ